MANPALVQGAMSDSNFLVPALFQGELMVLRRPGIDIWMDGLQTSNGLWKGTGELFLTTYRLVFVAKKPDASGLQAFDLPLAYLFGEKFNQPIFGCNNLSGSVWPPVEGGGPGGQYPPHKFKFFFNRGGCGTFLPLFYGLLGAARFFAQNPLGTAEPPPAASPPVDIDGMMNNAFVDPSDPSTIFLTQPVPEEERLPSRPVYAANYGRDEKYEPM